MIVTIFFRMLIEYASLMHCSAAGEQAIAFAVRFVNNFCEIFLSKLPPVFEYGRQTFLIFKLGVFYLKLKLFGSTSIAGGLFG